MSDYYDPDPTAPDKTYSAKAAFIDGYSYDWARRRTPKSTVDSTDIVHWLALDVALQALQDAGFSKNTLPKKRSGTILGNTLTGEQTRAEGLRLRWPFICRVLKAAAKEKGLTPKTIDELLRTMEMYYKSVFAPITEDSLAGGLSNTIAGRICNYLDIHGGGYTVDGACSSSLIAVYTAANALSNGDLDIALAGGVDISLDTFELIGFAKTGALSKSDMTVYDRHADGFFPGEGCGFVVLQRLEDAIKEKRNIYAVLRGWGISSDGKGGLTAPNARGQALALQRAYEVAGYGIREVDFFEGHGTGTSVGDKAELEAIALVLGEKEGPLRTHGITSLKSIIGHTKAAAGIGGFIKAVIAVNRRVLPPTANCFEPAAVFHDTARSLYPILAGEVLSESVKLRAGISAMGFGGINCHVTIESNGAPSKHLAPGHDERKLLASWQETELFVLGASSTEKLKDRAQEIRSLIYGMSEAELVDLAFKLSRELDDQALVRASIIAGSPEVLLEGLHFVENKLAQTPPLDGEIFISRRKDIFIGNKVSACRMGFLFPGQGSQLLNMAKILVDRHDWAQEMVKKADEWLLADSDGQQEVQAIFRPLERAADSEEVGKWQEVLKQTETAQPAICLASLLWMEKLSRLGIRPDVVAGHSLGELTAFKAAGIFDAETLMRFALFRGRAMAAPAKRTGVMASLECTVETATKIISSVNGYVVVANVNSPKQTVISGEKESVAQAVELAKSREIKTHSLRTSNAFHSKFSQKAADLLRTCRLIPQIAGSIAVKIFSGMNGMEILPGHNLPDHFSNQAMTPVNFISLIEAMAGECDLMVEVGPGKILSKLVDNILFEYSSVCLPLESVSGQYRDLNTVMGHYFVRGGLINWKAFFEDRLVRPFTPAADRSFIESPCERPFNVQAARKQFDTGAAESIEPALTAALDISPRQLEEYLRVRSKFLESIIKADIENLPQFQIKSEQISQADAAVSATNGPEILNRDKQQESTKAKPAGSVEDLLYELIEKRTGFPRQSLSAELRLLDDLNLDSIKAGDLLAEMAIQLKVAGDFDISPYANAKLREISNAFGGAKAGKITNRHSFSMKGVTEEGESIRAVVLLKAAELMGRPVETVKEEALLGADLNLSVEDCGKLIQYIAHELKIELNVDLPPLLGRSLAQVAEIVKRILLHRKTRKSPPRSIARRPWVREIHGELIETPALPSDVRQGRRHEDKWQHARVLILGSEIARSTAAELQSYLDCLGAEVTLRELHKELEPDSGEETTEYSHLILLLPQEVGELDAEDVRLEEMIARLASIASPPPAAAGPRRRTTVAYIQFGGGRFGMHPKAGYLNRCCASALAKSLHLERDDLRVRVLDFDPALPALTVAEKIAFELHSMEGFAAVGYDLSLTRRELKQRLLSPAEYRDRPFSWSKEDVILVTGGAKGITAACALGVSRATGARMALLGRSTHPDDQPESQGNMEITSTLKEYADRGLTAQYYCCDVSDHESVKKVVRQIRKSMGPITGVIHGAGLNVPRLINQVSIREALQEVSPKILGIINLMTELKESPPRLFVGFSSIIGVTGMPGNGWYGFSNESLDVLLHRIEADFPQTKALSVAFSIWREEGMGTRMGSVGVLKQKGIDSIPTEEGVKRFTRLFVKDPGVHQVIISARLDGLDTWQWQARIPEPKGRFLEEQLHITPGVEAVFQVHLSLETDPYLKDHVFNGSFLFPAVFGLEAMAQVVGHVTGQYDFSRVRIENIQLKRPITVDPENGADIVVWAELAEPENSSPLQIVHAGVYKQGTGQGSDYFSATFVLGLEEKSEKFEIDLPEKPLEILPREDLYDRKILFQGTRFQRLQHIYSLDSRKCVFDSEFHPSDSAINKERWLLGDPYFRDSLLHSTQLPVSQHTCLPVSIASLERYSAKDMGSGSMPGFTVIERRTDEEVHGSVVTTDGNGQVVERLNGYVLKIMEHHPEYPAPEEIVDPGKRDETIIKNELKRRADLFKINIPAFTVTTLSGLKELTKKGRRRRELSILRKTVKQALGRNGKKSQDIDISWLDSGKPVLCGKELSRWNLSLSHDGETVLCTAGEGDQGCDIESITHRTREEWDALLGEKRASLLDALVRNSELMDKAGTRIWSAMEAAFKAFGSRNIDLEIENAEGDAVFFRGGDTGDKDCRILTFPVTLTRGSGRMVAVTVKHSSKKTLAFSQGKEFYAERFNFELNSYKVHMAEGPQGQPKFVFQFPVTFRETSNPSRTLYFSHYFTWLGKLRESVIHPIYEKLVDSFSSGKWGMVTNQAKTCIFGFARAGDLIEGHVWFNKVGGKAASTIEMCFEWWKKLPQGNREQIAFSRMSTTWVATLGNGNVEVKPLPEFVREFLAPVMPPSDSSLEIPYVPPSESALSNTFGDELYREPAGPPQQSALLKECIFDTSYEDSNLVGNIYFSNYYLWQGRLRDIYLNELFIEHPYTLERKGELRCVDCKINHLNEAMPFDRIAVRMYRVAVYRKAIRLYFDYYTLTKDGIHRKLAYGEHDAVWYEQDSSGRWMPSELNAAIIDDLIGKKNNYQEKLQKSRNGVKRRKYDVLIIGAGIGGLTAGALLAKKGKKVVILEQHNKPGGFCTSWERSISIKGGEKLRFIFDAGVFDIAAFDNYSTTLKVLKELGADDKICWQRVDQEYISPDFRLKVPEKFKDFTDILCSQFPGQKDELDSFFEEIEACFYELYEYQNQTKKEKLSRINRWINARYTDLLDAFFQDQKLKELFTVLVYYIADDPASINALTVIPLFGFYMQGGKYPVGGSQVLSNTLAATLKENNGEIRLESLVSSIIVEDGGVSGVRLKSNENINADIVISNADVRRTFMELVGKDFLPEHFAKRISELKPSNSAYLVSLGVNFIPDINPATFLYNGSDVLAVMVPSKVDPSLAPPGYSCITLVKFLPHEQAIRWDRSDPTYGEKKQNFGNKLISMAENAVPDLAKHIVYRQDASPATFSRYARTTDGAIYGLASTEWRPPMKTPISGFYLVGAGTTARPGIEDAVFSGIKVAEEIIGHCIFENN